MLQPFYSCLSLQGLWSRFFPVYDQLRADLRANAYGKVQYLNVDFGFPLWSKVNSNARCGGALFAVGVYNIQLALMFFGEEPERIEANAIIPEKPHGLCPSFLPLLFSPFFQMQIQDLDQSHSI